MEERQGLAVKAFGLDLAVASTACREMSAMLLDLQGMFARGYGTRPFPLRRRVFAQADQGQQLGYAAGGGPDARAGRGAERNRAA